MRRLLWLVLFSVLALLMGCRGEPDKRLTTKRDYDSTQIKEE